MPGASWPRDQTYQGLWDRMMPVPLWYVEMNTPQGTSCQNSVEQEPSFKATQIDSHLKKKKKIWPFLFKNAYMKGKENKTVVQIK